MPAYDSVTYHPPAPLALVTVRSPTTGATVANVPLLLDSGADVSVLPRDPIAELISSEQEPPQFELEGFDGTRSWAPVVRLELQFLGKTFLGQFLVMDGGHGILGRNVLNALSILLDGPSLTWKENR
jgi:hypothetical protein